MPAQDQRSGAAASAVLGAMEPDSQWPSVTRHHQTGGISRPHQPATCREDWSPCRARIAVAVARRCIGYRSTRPSAIGGASGSTPVMAPPAQGRWQPAANWNGCLLLGPERATYASPGQTQRRSRKCSPGCDGARFTMAERYAHHQTGGISRPHQPATCRRCLGRRGAGGGRGHVPVYWIRIDATAGNWLTGGACSTPVMAPPAQGRWQPGSKLMAACFWALKGPPMPALDKRSGAAASAVQGAMKPDSKWPSVTLAIKPAAFRGHINPQPAAGAGRRGAVAVAVTRRCIGYGSARSSTIGAVRPVAHQLWLHRRRAGGSLAANSSGCLLLGPERATYASPGQTQRRSRKCSPGCDEARSKWPSVTRTITPAAFRGHINPQPAAERLRCRTDCDRGCTPVRRIRIGAIAGDWPVRLVAHQLWLHRQGRWQLSSGLQWLLLLGPERATYASPGQTQRRSRKCSPGCDEAGFNMAERYAHHQTGGISRPHQPATCRKVPVAEVARVRSRFTCRRIGYGSTRPSTIGLAAV